MSDRKRNEEDYRRLQVEGNELKNAVICNRIADDSLMWNPGEAIYWRKKAIKKLEEINGKRNIEDGRSDGGISHMTLSDEIRCKAVPQFFHKWGMNGG